MWSARLSCLKALPGSVNTASSGLSHRSPRPALLVSTSNEEAPELSETTRGSFPSTAPEPLVSDATQCGRALQQHARANDPDWYDALAKSLEQAAERMGLPPNCAMLRTAARARRHAAGLRGAQDTALRPRD